MKHKQAKSLLKNLKLMRGDYKKSLLSNNYETCYSLRTTHGFCNYIRSQDNFTLREEKELIEFLWIFSNCDIPYMDLKQYWIRVTIEKGNTIEESLTPRIAIIDRAIESLEILINKRRMIHTAILIAATAAAGLLIKYLLY